MIGNPPFKSSIFKSDIEKQFLLTLAPKITENGFRGF